MAEVTGRRPLFGPLVLAGLATGALTAVAATKQMMRVDEGALADLGVPAEAISRIEPDSDLQALGASVPSVSGDLPLAAGLALVVLACWGVVLVTRGRVRIVVAALTFVAAAGVLAALVVGLLTGTDSYADAIGTRVGAGPEVVDQIAVDPTGWFWTACVGAILSVAVAAASVPRVAAWPTMGGRYDAPGSEPTPTASEDDPTNLDLWKAMDRGDDPTA